MAEGRQVGWREVLIVAALAVALVLGLDVITTNQPDLKAAISRFPVLIVVMLVGTAALLWRISAHRPPEV